MSTPERAVLSGADLETAALERARALARAIGESSAFRAFEAAQQALQDDGALAERLQAFQRRQQELRFAQEWGSTDPAQMAALEEEWSTLSAVPTLQEYLRAQEELTGLLSEVVGVLNGQLGLDYGAICAPAGSCCG
jgi:cell fate (sporulation/competence/biofilm development) regulator YlbF (YheA/YmcA/DUF963 family)